MPLPKPPAKKGDLLQSADYEAQAAPRAEKRSLKSRGAEAPAQATLELHDGGTPLAARPAAPVSARLPATSRAAAPQPAVRLSPVPAPTPRPRKPRSERPEAS